MLCTNCNKALPLIHGHTQDHDIPVPLAHYLFTRLSQLGIRTIHGVPSTYNLPALEAITSTSLQWTGTTNDLNAAYAADGHARIAGISALMTSFGPGELSALSAVAGSFAEKVPVVVISCMPSTTAQHQCLNVHGSLGDGDLKKFANLYKQFTCAQADLCDRDRDRDPSSAPREIDRVLRLCLVKSQPVYIGLPTDTLRSNVPSISLYHGLNLRPQTNYPAHETFLAREILHLIEKARNPLIIIDGCTARLGLLREAEQLIRVTGWPTFVTPFGKSCVDESHANFHGVLSSRLGRDTAVRAYLHAADLVVRFAPLDSDFNTAGFRTVPAEASRVDIYRRCIQLTGCTVHPRNVGALLRRVLGELEVGEPGRRYRLVLYPQPYPDLPRPRDRLCGFDFGRGDPDVGIDQETFWARMSGFLRAGDVVVTETGIASVGGLDLVLPAGVRMVNSALWMAEGSAFPAALGASIAQRDQGLVNGGSFSFRTSRSASISANSNRGTNTSTSKSNISNIGKNTQPGRTILFTDTTSFQKPISTLSDIFRTRSNIIIFLLNNSNHVVHRKILSPSSSNGNNKSHSPSATYHTLQTWDYLEAPAFFGAPRNDPSYPVSTTRVMDWGEALSVLGDGRVNAGIGFCLVEVLGEWGDGTVLVDVEGSGLAMATAEEEGDSDKNLEDAEARKKMGLIGTGEEQFIDIGGSNLDFLKYGVGNRKGKEKQCDVRSAVYSESQYSDSNY